MRLKILIFILSLCLNVSFGQAVSKIENNKEIEIDYILSAKKSTVILTDTTSFMQKLIELFPAYALKNEDNKMLDLTLITAIHIIRIDKNKFNYQPNKNRKFAADNLLNDFISTQVLLNDFKNISRKTQIGIYFTYNIQDHLLMVELCEIKKNKYYLINRMKRKVLP